MESMTMRMMKPWRPATTSTHSLRITTLRMGGARARALLTHSLVAHSRGPRGGGTVGHLSCCGVESGCGWFRPSDEPTLGETPGARIRATGDLSEDRLDGETWPSLFETLPRGIVSNRKSPVFSSNCTDKPIKCIDRMHKGSKGAMTETGVVDYADEDQINSADEERIIGVAMDSGAVDHTTGPQHLPANTEIVPLQGDRVGRNLVAANGSPLQMHGQCTLEMEADDGVCAGTFAVTDVTRTLQSVSKTCDQNLGAFFTKDDCKVLDSETVAAIEQLIKGRKNAVRARYPRSGGLYVRHTKVRSFKPGTTRPTGQPTTTQPRPPQPRPPQQQRQPSRPQQPRRPQQVQRPVYNNNHVHNNGNLLDFTRQGNKR